MAKILLVSDGGANFANVGPGATGLMPVYHFSYDFAVLGGATGTIVLTQHDGPLPQYFIAQNTIIDVITPLASAGAAVSALTTGQTANDLIAATVVAGAPWSAAGLKATLMLLGTIATQAKMTASRSPAIVNSVFALNAGKFELYIQGVQSNI